MSKQKWPDREDDDVPPPRRSRADRQEDADLQRFTPEPLDVERLLEKRQELESAMRKVTIQLDRRQANRRDDVSMQWARAVDPLRKLLKDFRRGCFFLAGVIVMGLAGAFATTTVPLITALAIFQAAVVIGMTGVIIGLISSNED